MVERYQMNIRNFMVGDRIHFHHGSFDTLYTIAAIDFSRATYLIKNLKMDSQTTITFEFVDQQLRDGYMTIKPRWILGWEESLKIAQTANG